MINQNQPLEFWICELIGDYVYQDWTDIENPGAEKTIRVILSRIVCDDSSDKICIGAYGKDEKYLQYDSYEAYHAQSFFAQNFETHGLEFKMRRVSVSMNDVKEI